MSIREEREKLGLSQKDLADLLSITPSALCQWESGKVTPRKKQMKLLSLIFRCPESELINEAE